LSQHELQALPQLNPTPANTATTNWPAPLPPHNCETQILASFVEFEKDAQREFGCLQASLAAV
jgi:hypothetical protein